MPFNTALSGLKAASSDLAVTANNIANTNTTGFKGSRAEFAELYSNASDNLGASSVGSGVNLLDVAQQFTAGNIENTGNSLDFAISGDGFFVLKDGSGYSYTRAGAFQQDRNGNVVNPAGQNLQVFPPNGNGGFDTSTMTDLHLDTSQQPAQASSTIGMNLNLPANATAPTLPFDPANSATYNHSSTFTVYDSLGATHSATAYFVKNATGTNSWTAKLYVDGAADGSQSLSFDSSGKLVSPANGQLAFNSITPNAGANPLQLTLDMSGATQFGNTFSVTSINDQNGHSAGTLSGVNVSNSGVVSATYSNGQSRSLGQVAMASFANPQGLQQVDNTNWTSTFKSGNPVLGAPGTGKLGGIQSGALESSNTADLTQQLVNMIQAQRNYQANAKVLSTDDTLTKTLINMQP